MCFQFREFVLISLTITDLSGKNINIGNKGKSLHRHYMEDENTQELQNTRALFGKGVTWEQMYSD